MLERPLQTFLLNGVQAMKLLSKEFKKWEFADYALLFEPVSLFKKEGTQRRRQTMKLFACFLTNEQTSLLKRVFVKLNKDIVTVYR